MIDKLIIILGAPGAGKNVIAEHLAFCLGMSHVNYRSVMIEAAVSQNDARAQGLRNSREPFPAVEAFNYLMNHIQRHGITSMILDGYPKSTEEATEIKEIARETHIVNISLEDEVIHKRLKNRLVCEKCNYVLYDPQPTSILEIECINCHIPLIRRSDDEGNDLLFRIKRYQNEIEPILKELGKFSLIHHVDGSRPISIVISDAIDVLSESPSEGLAERGARMLVEGLGLNLFDPNIIGTPTRIVKSLKGLMGGQYIESYQKMKKDLATVFPTKYKGMIILEPIRCVSLCSHHLLPVQYEVYFGYLVADKSLGFSKIVKVINTIAAKPTLQEDFTEEITDVFNAALQPQGIMVVVKGVHTCMSMRGDRSANINTTFAVRGVFKTEQSVREEFLLLAGIGRN